MSKTDRALLLAIILSLVAARISGQVALAQTPGAAPLQVLLLDCSGSTEWTDPDGLARSAARAIVDLLAPAPLGFIPFWGDGVQEGSGQVKPLTTQVQRHELKNAITHAPRNGGTPLASALQECRRLLSDANAPAGSACWVFTDGKPEPDTQAQLEAMQKMVPELVERGWRVYAIAFADAEGPFATFLEEFASSTGGTAYRAATLRDVQHMFLEVYTQATGRSLYQLTDHDLGGVGGLEQPLEVDASSTSLTIVAFRDPGLAMTLVAPDDSEVGPDHPSLTWASEDPYYQIWALNIPTPGRWRFVASGTGHVQAVYFADSDVAVKLVSPAPPAVLPVGRPVRLVATFEMRGQPALSDPINQARIWITVTSPSGKGTKLEMHDDGDREGSGDEYASDGRFTAHYMETSQPGPYQVRLELTTVGGQRTLNTAFSLASFPCLSLTPPVADSVDLKPGEPLVIHGQVTLDGNPFDLVGWQVDGILARRTGAELDLTSLDTEVDGHQVALTAVPEGTGAYTVTATLRGTFRSVPYEHRVEMPLGIGQVPLAWQMLPEFRVPSLLPRGEALSLPMVLTANGAPIAPEEYKLKGSLRGPGGQPADRELRGPSLTGNEVQFHFAPAAAGMYTFTLQTLLPDGRPVMAPFEVPLLIAFEPFDPRPYLIGTEFVLIGIATVLMRRNWQRCPRPLGLLQDTQTLSAYPLSAMRDRIHRLSRCLGRPRLAGHKLNAPGLESVQFQVRRGGNLRVRSVCLDSAMLNGERLTRHWRPLLPGQTLTSGDRNYRYILQGSGGVKTPESPVPHVRLRSRKTTKRTTISQVATDLPGIQIQESPWTLPPVRPLDPQQKRTAQDKMRWQPAAAGSGSSGFADPPLASYSTSAGLQGLPGKGGAAAASDDWWEKP